MLWDESVYFLRRNTSDARDHRIYDPHYYFFLLRYGMCFRDLAHTRKRSAEAGVYLPVKRIYQEMGLWLGAAAGISIILFAETPYLFIALTAVLMLLGRWLGRRYCLRRDRQAATDASFHPTMSAEEME